jgi:hypothetical protein
VTDSVWALTPPYKGDAPKDRWLRITWAARHYQIDRTTLFAWVKDGTVLGHSSPSGNWFVSEVSLQHHLFGSTDASS